MEWKTAQSTLVSKAGDEDGAWTARNSSAPHLSHAEVGHACQLASPCASDCPQTALKPRSASVPESLSFTTRHWEQPLAWLGERQGGHAAEPSRSGALNQLQSRETSKRVGMGRASAAPCQACRQHPEKLHRGVWFLFSWRSFIKARPSHCRTSPSTRIGWILTWQEIGRAHLILTSALAGQQAWLTSSGK
jgi:hypothetical protein